MAVTFKHVVYNQAGTVINGTFTTYYDHGTGSFSGYTSSFWLSDNTSTVCNAGYNFRG